LIVADRPAAPPDGDEAPCTELATADPAAELRFSLGRARAWLTANRARTELLLIGGIAIGGIVCMMVITVVVLIVQLRR
jgi:hypothetical protein